MQRSEQAGERVAPVFAGTSAVQVPQRLAWITALAEETLGTGEKASLWLRSPNAVLEGKAPVELLDSEAGFRAVEAELGRIAWGVYS